MQNEPANFITMHEGAIPKPSSGSLFATPTKGPKHELIQAIELEEAKERNEVILPSDQQDSQLRHILIAATAYGIHRHNDIALFAGCTVTHVKEQLAKPEIIKQINEGTHCLTKSELLAKLSVIATKSQTDNNKLTAIKMLMDYRGMTAPEGGSRSFKRTVQRFITGE